MKMQIKMAKMLKFSVIFLLFIILISGDAGAQERSREQLREAYLETVHKNEKQTSVNLPSIEASYSADAEQALGSINFIRYLAGLAPVELSGGMNDLAQHCAVLMAANGMLSHEPQQPDGMDDAAYEKGRQAAGGCNLAMFNWSAEGLLSQAVLQFAQDEGESNQYVLGHRRWMLYPYMKYTGLGLASDEDGRSYAAMYVLDDSAQNIDYDMICFPSGGAFPAEYMHTNTPWSISFNPDKYDLLSSTPYLTMTEQGSGAVYLFERLNTQQELEDCSQYFILSGGRYGDGPAYIFRPDLSEYDALMYGYEQNQVWNVRIEGMKYADGTPCAAIEYRVEMASLTPIDPSAVEISPRSREMNVGESAVLSAQVIPGWADDLSVAWSSTDEWVAQVDKDGVVHANGKGTCEIIARTVNGREDRITVVVN